MTDRKSKNLSKVEILKKQLEEAVREEQESTKKTSLNDSQLKYFGQTNEHFSYIVLKTKIRKCNSQQAINDIKKYILTYFIKSADSECVLMWNPSTTKHKSFKYKDIKSMYFTKSLIANYNGNKFNVTNWFFEDYDCFFYATMDPHQPIVFKEKTTFYLNYFTGYKYNNREAYDEKVKNKKFKEEMNKGIEMIWNHIFVSWCSRNKNQFNYVKMWISNLIKGKKMRTALYLKNTMEGTGKGIITNFLLAILGISTAVRIQSTSFLKSDGYNSILLGKVFALLDEMPCASQAVWNEISDSLKGYITEPRITIRQKYLDEFESNNIANFIITTNNNAIRIQSPKQRRYVILDLSTELVGNKEYFSNLAKVVSNESVMEAFYWHCIDIDTSNFNEDNIPESLLSEGMEKIKYKSFYQSFKLSMKDTKVSAENETKQIIKDYGIILKPYGSGSTLHFMMNKEDLLNLFKSRKMISDIDEFEEDDDDYEFSDDDIETLNNPNYDKITKENVQLKKRIAELELQLFGTKKVNINKNTKIIDVNDSIDFDESTDDLGDLDFDDSLDCVDEVLKVVAKPLNNKRVQKHNESKGKYKLVMD
eukprot:gene9075-11115_t